MPPVHCRRNNWRLEDHKKTTLGPYKLPVPISQNTRMGEAEIFQTEIGHKLLPQNPEKHDFIRFMGPK